MFSWVVNIYMSEGVPVCETWKKKIKNKKINNKNVQVLVLAFIKTLYTFFLRYTLLNSTRTTHCNWQQYPFTFILLPPVSMHLPSHLVFDLFFLLLVHLTILVVALFVNFVFELLMFFDLLFYNLPF